jgi:hypothetical protein
MTTRRNDFEKCVRALAPRIPKHEFAAIVDHALTSRGLFRATPEQATWLSLVAYVPHVHTDYDDLLAAGYDVESARPFVREQINAVLNSWDVRRRLSDEAK